MLKRIRHSISQINKRRIKTFFLQFIVPIIFNFGALFISLRLLNFQAGRGIFIFFFLATIISTWAGRLVAGLFSTLLSLSLIDLYFMNPIGSLQINSMGDFFILVIFALISIAVSLSLDKTIELIDRTQSTLSDLLQSHNYGFAQVDFNWKIRRINKEFAQIVGLPESEIINKYLNDIFPDFFESELFRNLEENKRRKTLINLDEFFKYSRKWLRINAFQNVLNKRFELHIKDITETKELEQNSKKAEIYFDKLLESNIIGLVFTKAQGEIVSMNDAFPNMLGYTVEESKEQKLNWEDISPPEYKYLDERINQEILKSGISNIYEKEYIKKDGSRLPVLIGVVMMDPDLELTLCFVVDITLRKEAESRIRESEERFRLIADSAPALIWMWDPKDGAVFLNQGWLSFTGKPWEIEKGDGWLQSIHPDDLPQAKDFFIMATSRKQAFNMEYRLRRFDGEYRWVISKGVPRFTKDKEFQGYIGLCLDITDRKIAEKRLKESEERFRTLVNSMNDIVLLLNKDKKYIGIYGQWFKKTEINPKDFINKITDTSSNKHGAAIHNKNYDLALQGQNIIYEWEANYRPIGKVYFQNSISPFYNQDHKIDGLVVVARDITKEKMTQLKLQESNRQVNSILQSITDAFIALDNDWKFIYINSQAEKFLNVKLDALQGKKIWDVFPELIGSPTYENFYKALNEERTVAFEDRYDSNTWFDIHVYPTDDGLAIYYTDITARKEYETQINQLLLDLDISKGRLDNIISNIPGVVWETWAPEEENRDKNYVSDYILNMTGYKPEEWLGENKFWLKIMHPDDRESAWKESINIGQSGKEGILQYRWITKDGKTIWTETHETSIKDFGGNPIGMRGVTMDITARKEVEEDLKESKDQLSVTFENVADGIIVINGKGKIVYLNNQAAASCGFDSVDAMIEASEKGTLQEVVSEKFIIKDIHGEDVQDLSSITSRRALNGERRPEALFNYIDKKTGKEFWANVKSRAIIDDEGKIQFIVTVLSDVTERRELEKRKDEFISIASHELKTPLTTIKAFTQILLNKFRQYEDKESESYLQKMDKQVNRLTYIVSDLLDISRIEAGKLKLNKENFNIKTLLVEVIENLKVVNTTHALIPINLVDVEINADKGRIEQVLINLINNAVKYSPEENKVEINSFIDKDKVVISIKDFGVGIAPEEQDKIFARFYMGQGTQKSRFFGLGLGLYISSEIIRRHKGNLWVDSIVGHGSTFYFSLPIENK